MTAIEKMYDAESFRSTAHKLVDSLADYLLDVKNKPAIPYVEPSEALAYWQRDFENGITEEPNLLFEDIINKSIHLHHPRYMGHQVCVVAPIAAVSSLLDGFLNNGMAVYEMGMVANALENLISKMMAKKIGYDDKSGGILTSGGTLGNLTAMLAARAKKAPTDVWTKGSSEKLAIMVSAEAHYCIDRAARIMGLGDDGIIKIPTDDNFQMRTDLLADYCEKATNEGFTIIAIIGSSCSTSTGSYDDLVEIGKFAQEKNIWFHVDGAHGGAVIFSKKHKHYVKGIENADSVVIDWHKMLLTPALVTAVVFKDNADCHQTFQQKAQYLWDNQTSRDWYNSGKRTFECTKLMMSVKVYAIIKTHGIDIFEEHVDYLYDLGLAFGQIIKTNPSFELGANPSCNIVCFKPKNFSNDQVKAVRNQLLVEGKFYIVQTDIMGITYLRVSLMNPLTKITDCQDLLTEIEIISKKLGFDID